MHIPGLGPVALKALVYLTMTAAATLMLSAHLLLPLLLLRPLSLNNFEFLHVFNFFFPKFFSVARCLVFPFFSENLVQSNLFLAKDSLR